MSEGTTTERLEPIRKTLRVPAVPEEAFRRFTAEMDGWWPLGTHSVFGEESEGVEVGEGEGLPIVERGAGGRTGVWGTVTVWDPPRRVAFTWHPGRDATTAGEVEVTFRAVEGGTEVTLLHGGWDRLGEGAAGERRSYDGGWDVVLRGYTGAF